VRHDLGAQWHLRESTEAAKEVRHERCLKTIVSAGTKKMTALRLASAYGACSA
jgi:hypothetical protein